jgi:hypothetical protein
MDAAWIAEQRATVLGHEAAIKLDGEWEVPPEGQVFPAFDWRSAGEHVTAEPMTGEADLYLGIDHGERDHKQVVVLVAVQGGGRFPLIHILDEYVGEGLTTHEQDARGVLDMLGRWGCRWQDLQAASGDKPHDVHHIRHSVARKHNLLLHKAIAEEMQVRAARLRPDIRQAKTGGQTVGRLDYGVRWLHEQMLRHGHFRIQARCKHTIDALRRWAWKDDEHKDKIDALRYALEPVIMRVRRTTSPSVVEFRT